MTADALVAEARRLHADRKAIEAEALYRQALALAPEHAGALFGLGVLALQARRLAEAAAWLRRALAADPADPAGDVHEALASVLRRMGDGEGAACAYAEAARRRPASAEAQLNLGAALADLGRYALAAAAFRQATALAPALVAAWSALALSLTRLGRDDEALAAAEAGLARASDAVDLLALAASSLKTLGRLEAAEAVLRRLLVLRPADRAAAFNLAGVMKEQGRTDEAVAALRTLAQADPRDGAVRLALCMAHLAPLYRDAAEIERRRRDYAAELDRLSDDTAAWGAGFLADAVGVAQPFALPYQGGHDRALQSAYGAIVCAALAARFEAAPLPPPPSPGERLRVGFVSGFFRDHANWRIPVEGWMRSLDPARFTVIGYHTGPGRDAATEEVQALCATFHQGPLPLEAWRETILNDAPHVLIYPEIGMDPVAAQLAALRLAPLQANGWGHPVTSGYPTLDLFLSSELMEPPGAEAAYSERLVRLAGLSAPVRLRPSPSPPPRVALGLRDGAVVFWCAQTPSKHLPQFDDVWPRIALAAGGDCQFVFAAFPGSDALTRRFRDRLHAAFARHRVDGERCCLILPRLEPQAFAAASGCADIVLDSLEWSGCNSIVDTLAHDRPIVTLPGAYMRGRHAAALLRVMGLEDAVTGSLDDYIARAARLARDTGLRATMGARIGAGKIALETSGRGGLQLDEVLLAELRRVSRPSEP